LRNGGASKKNTRKTTAKRGISCVRRGQLAMTSKETTVPIKIAQAIAECDGSVSGKEAKLIKELPGKLGIKDPPYSGNEPVKTLKDLGSELDSHGDRCLAAKIGYMVAAISKNQGDQADINADEINEIEWAARQEIQRGGTLIQLIKEALTVDGSWPDRELMGPEIPGL